MTWFSRSFPGKRAMQFPALDRYRRRFGAKARGRRNSGVAVDFGRSYTALRFGVFGEVSCFVEVNHAHTLVIDLQTRKLSATIDLGKPLRPHRAEFGPDGLLYVTAELANAVDVIDPSTRKVLAEIPTGEPQSHMLVLSSDGRRGYTANVSAGSVSVLDLPKRSLITTIPVAKIVQRISISPDGR